jgi:hypothetical protein
MDELLIRLTNRCPGVPFEKQKCSIVFKTDGIDFSVVQNGEINEPALKSYLRMYKFDKIQDKLIKDGFSGRYAVIAEDDDSVKFFSTETEAIDFIESNPNSFFRRIGCSNALF